LIFKLAPLLPNTYARLDGHTRLLARAASTASSPTVRSLAHRTVLLMVAHLHLHLPLPVSGIHDLVSSVCDGKLSSDAQVDVFSILAICGSDHPSFERLIEHVLDVLPRSKAATDASLQLAVTRFIWHRVMRTVKLQMLFLARNGLETVLDVVVGAQSAPLLRATVIGMLGDLVRDMPSSAKRIASYAITRAGHTRTVVDMLVDAWDACDRADSMTNGQQYEHQQTSPVEESYDSWRFKDRFLGQAKSSTRFNISFLVESIENETGKVNPSQEKRGKLRAVSRPEIAEPNTGSSCCGLCRFSAIKNCPLARSGNVYKKSSLER
jgi:hypothetical protein